LAADHHHNNKNNNGDYLENNSNKTDEEEHDERLQQDFVKYALYELRHVPAFYNHCIELVCSTRRAIVTKRFLLALTSGLNDGATPIEMKAHDLVACTLYIVCC
jgi:hypothetical protein